MNHIEQLDYVKKYFIRNSGRKVIKTLEDVYMVVIWPAAIGEPLSYVLWEKNFVHSDKDWEKYVRKCYVQNKHFDKKTKTNPKDGKITKAEISVTMHKKLIEGKKIENFG